MSAITAVDSPEDEPDPRVAARYRWETGSSHVTWCVGSCDGQCTTQFQVGPLVGTAVLHRSAAGLTFTLSDGVGKVTIPAGAVDGLVRYLSTLPVSVPPRWRRQQS